MMATLDQKAPSGTENTQVNQATESMDIEQTRKAQKRTRDGNGASSDEESVTKKVSTDALTTAIAAASVACEIVDKAADDFYLEEGIGPLLRKVAQALNRVTDALFKVKAVNIRQGECRPVVTTNAYTNTEPPIKKNGKKNGVKKSDARTPNYQVPTQSKDKGKQESAKSTSGLTPTTSSIETPSQPMEPKEDETSWSTVTKRGSSKPSGSNDRAPTQSARPKTIRAKPRRF